MDPEERPAVASNAIYAIHPYRYHGSWVFDDERVGLVREPFVAGADTILDRMNEIVPGTDKGMVLLFATIPFPGHQYTLTWLRFEYGGDVYRAEELDMDGWLCPALRLYYPEAPASLYVEVREAN